MGIIIFCLHVLIASIDSLINRTLTLFEICNMYIVFVFFKIPFTVFSTIDIIRH